MRISLHFLLTYGNRMARQVGSGYSTKNTMVNITCLLPRAGNRFEFAADQYITVSQRGIIITIISCNYRSRMKSEKIDFKRNVSNRANIRSS